MNIYNGLYFPWPVRVVAVILAIAGIVSISSTRAPLLGTVLVIGSAIVLTTYQGVRIDKAKKCYQEYTAILGWKVGEEVTFNHFEYLFIKPTKITQTYSSRIQETTIRDIAFDGYLRFSENDKLHILQSKNKQTVVDKLLELKTYLDTRVIDYTKETADEI